MRCLRTGASVLRDSTSKRFGRRSRAAASGVGARSEPSMMSCCCCRPPNMVWPVCRCMQEMSRCRCRREQRLRSLPLEQGSAVPARERLSLCLIRGRGSYQSTVVLAIIPTDHRGLASAPATLTHTSTTSLHFPPPSCWSSTNAFDLRSIVSTADFEDGTAMRWPQS